MAKIERKMYRYICDTNSAVCNTNSALIQEQQRKNKTNKKSQLE